MNSYYSTFEAHNNINRYNFIINERDFDRLENKWKVLNKENKQNISNNRRAHTVVVCLLQLGVVDPLLPVAVAPQPAADVTLLPVAVVPHLLDAVFPQLDAAAP